MKKTLLTLIAFILGLSAFSQIPNDVPQNGLVGWWPFNGNANDESGNGNNGTVNGATLTADRFSNLNSSYSFSNSSIICANSNIPDNIFSLSVWVYKNLSFGDIEYICLGSPSNTRWGTISNSSYTTLNYGRGCSGSGGSSINSMVDLNNWAHIVYVSQGVGLNTDIFINGNFAGSSVNNNTGGCSTNNLYFGVDIFSIPEYIDGKLDDIGIWNRALTDCEIQDLYHAQLNSASQFISAGADQSICAGDNVTLNGAGGSNYQWNNNVLDGQAFTPTQSNAYVVTAQDTLGCTGTDTVMVTVLENSVSTLSETALDSYTLNGQTYTQSGTYTQTLTAANGCDSTITLNLTLNFTGIDELGTNAKKLVNITDLNGKTIPRRKNTLMLFIYEDGTVERVMEMEE